MGRRITAVKYRRIGVWFSLALVIFALSAWAGSKIGTKVAVYRYRSDQKKSAGALGASEHAYIESLLDDLETVGIWRLPFILSPENDKLKQALPEQLANAAKIRQDLKSPQVKAVFDLNLAFAYVIASMDEEQMNNKEQAAEYMKSAQPLFESLGWQGYSEDAIRVTVNRDLRRWNPDPQVSVQTK